MLKLYSFYWDCGRIGELDGLFIADDCVVAETIGKNIYFGEVLGKHSEIYGVLEEKDLKVLSEDADKVNWLFDLMQGYNVSGYNPLNYIEEGE